MTKITHAFLWLCLACFLPAVSLAEALTDEKKQDIVKLMELTGALRVGQQMSSVVTRQMTQSLKVSRPDIPEEMYDILAEEVNSAIGEAMTEKGGFIEIITPVYHKYYTHEDIRQLLAFYQSDIGRKTVKVMPSLMQESMAAGRLWGERLAPTIQKRVSERFEAMEIDIAE